MQPWKQIFRKMELDLDVRSLKPGDYRMLTNGSPIQPYSSSYQNAVNDVVSNVIGNELVSNSLPSGTNQAIGCLQDRKSNRFFWCNWNSTAANCAIYQYQNGVITKVMQSSIFGWAQTDFVDMDIVGDVLIFTNNRNDIFKINVVKAIAGGVYTPLKEEITFIKPSPRTPLTFALGFDNNVDTNYINGNYFQFFYRWIYEDYDYSVFSPASQVCRGWLHPSGTDVDYATNVNVAVLSGNNAIDGETPSVGDRLLLLGQTITSNNGLWVRQVGAWTRPGDYPPFLSSTYYIKGGATFAQQIWRIDNVLGSGVFTKLHGPNYITVTRDTFGSPNNPATVIGIEYAVRVNASNELIVYRQEKTASFTHNHTFYNDSYLFTVPDADSFVWNDNVPLTSKSLKIFKNRAFLFNNVEGYTHNPASALSLSLVDVTVSSAGSISKTADKLNVPCFKNGGTYKIGLICRDFAGRHSGVKYESTIKIPDDPTKSYQVLVDDALVRAEGYPSWVDEVVIVCTKELTSSSFIQGLTQDIFLYKKDSSGNYTFNKSGSAEGMAFDIGGLTKQFRGYTFNQGDFIKIYQYISGTSGVIISLPGRVNVINVEITGQDGNFVFTELIPELILTSGASDNYYFEIYTPKKAQQEPFYETGVVCPKFISNQLSGDVEVGNFLVYRSTGSYSATTPTSNTYSATPAGIQLQWAQIQMMSVWTEVFPLWPTQAGRPIVKSDSRQINKYTYIRWGQQFILNANFLGLNTFYALDEQALPIENGAGTRLAEAGEVLVAVHEIETEAVYVGQGFVSIPGGQTSNQFLARTDNVVGDVRRYLGGYGCIDPKTIVSREGKIYFVDRRNGCIVRRAQDGLTVISDYGIRGLTSTLCSAHDDLALAGNSRIIAGWDPQYDCYCVSFIDLSGASPSGYTLYFHEETNGWVFITTMYPELWGLLGQEQFSFKDGQFWNQTIEGNYNKFYGVQYTRQLDMEFSPLRSLVHIWEAIEVDVVNIYATDGSNEDIVLLYNFNGDTLQTKINYKDFKQREGVWRSAFFRWLGDANFGSATESKYKSEKRIRGQSAFLTLKYNGTDINPMKSVTIFYQPSMISTP